MKYRRVSGICFVNSMSTESSSASGVPGLSTNVSCLQRVKSSLSWQTNYVLVPLHPNVTKTSFRYVHVTS